MLREVARADLRALERARIGAFEQVARKAKGVVQRMHQIEQGLEQGR